MADPANAPPTSQLPLIAGPAAAQPPNRRLSLFALRREIPAWQALAMGASCILACFALWWWATRGPSEERHVSPVVLPSPAETFGYFHTLWFDEALTRNTFASLRRVVLGFGLATLVGVPLGVLCGCFPRLRAFFAPVVIFGRNIPVAALIPLTFLAFGTNEQQKVLFIFIAVVAFIVADAAQSIAEISGQYIDTALTLGANWRQVILKVLVPLAMPNIFNSLRLLFGLAFGYIMLAEVVSSGGGDQGLGFIINMNQRFGRREPILLVLMIIPLVALVIDRLLFWIQRELFPYRYGGAGMLHGVLRLSLRGWETSTSVLRRDRTPERLYSGAGSGQANSPSPAHSGAGK